MVMGIINLITLIERPLPLARSKIFKPLRTNLQANEVHLEPSEWEKIFHNRCTTGGKVRELSIDGESCNNMAAIAVINKLQLLTKVHPIPYILQCFK